MGGHLKKGKFSIEVFFGRKKFPPKTSISPPFGLMYSMYLFGKLKGGPIFLMMTVDNLTLFTKHYAVLEVIYM